MADKDMNLSFGCRMHGCQCDRLRAEVEALRGLCDLQAMAIRKLERGRQLPKDIKDAIAALRGEGEK